MIAEADHAQDDLVIDLAIRLGTFFHDIPQVQKKIAGASLSKEMEKWEEDGLKLFKNNKFKTVKEFMASTQKEIDTLVVALGRNAFFGEKFKKHFESYNGGKKFTAKDEKKYEEVIKEYISYL